MAELLLSAVLPVLFDKLTSHELLKFATQEGVRSKLKKWKKTLRMIHALLIDAEEKQLTNGDVKMWLEDLQDLAYDAEDILDEYATEALSRKLKVEEHQASTSRARKLIPACCYGCTPHALWSDFNMRSKIDNITSRLQYLCDQKTKLELTEVKIEIAGRRPIGLPTTTSLPIEPVIYGRDEDKARVLEMLLSDEPDDDNYGVVSIIGMGGLGKTTLAQHVYNDEAMADFDPKGWVCVSDDFDVTKISKAIFESITKDETNSTNLDVLHNRLKEKLTGRKFLLVLDDVWSEDRDEWLRLRSPFMFGARGSKIIVTTRHQGVASAIGSHSGRHKLLGLSDDDCWSLFKKHAIDNEDWSSDLVEIRQKVVEKCKGLPLAARTLGGLLRSKERDEWLHILNSKMWELVDETVIPRFLQISYHHLPSHLKRCFAYCGILPKDYQFEENELVLLWMAEGLIQQSNGNKQLEELGGEYFSDLLSRSMFQISSHSSSKFIMHDLVNDLAQMVSGKLNFRLEDELESNNQLRISEKTRYASYLSRLYNLKNRFEVFNDFACLRTHLLVSQINPWYDRCYISNIVISDLFERFKKLRVLSLQNYCIIELPDSIGGLRLLRYLNLSKTQIKCLPESVKLMCNLQTLMLRYCRGFLKWPSSMGNLINLRHIDIMGATSIKHMPIGVKKWENIRTLSNFIVSRDFGSSLKDLKHLKFLSGELHISNLENVIVLENAIGSILDDKKDLKVLLLEWGSRFDESQKEAIELGDEEMDKKILDMLRPHQNLEKLTIRCYGGKTFSSWVGDSLFSKMTNLELEDCRKCTSLPSLGLLDSLKSLTVKGMKGLKNIDSIFYGQCCSIPFKSLETLCFKNLEEFESWNPVKENESFPKLKELSIINCPKLCERLPNKLSSLKKLVICGCEQLIVSLSSMPKLCELELDKCKKIMCTGSGVLESLEYMILSNISDFGDLSRLELKKVQNLTIKGCKELIELWPNEIFLEKPHQGLRSLYSLKTVYFINCNTLTTLPEGLKQKNAHVEELEIRNCDSLNFIFRGQLPQSLKFLNIDKCEKLQCLLGDNEETSTSTSSATFSLPSKEVNASTSHLEALFITRCSSLTCLPSMDQLFVTLTGLHVYECPKLTTLSMAGHLPAALKHLRIGSCSELTALLPKGQFFPETLETLRISYCKKLESIVEKFHNNQALREIEIRECVNLKSLPEGLETLSNLKSFSMYCMGLASFPKGGFPDSNLRGSSCEMLRALPSGIHTLSSLKIYNCPNMSLSEEDVPSKLTELSIESLKQYKLLTERGFHNFTSLRYLTISGRREQESFRETDMEIALPPNLTQLTIESLLELKCLPFKDFEDLSSLEILHIAFCPELTSLPSNLPSSLLGLFIRKCPLLKEACKRDKGKEWPKIADIPRVEIDDKFIYDPIP